LHGLFAEVVIDPGRSATRRTPPGAACSARIALARSCPKGFSTTSRVNTRSAGGLTSPLRPMPSRWVRRSRGRWPGNRVGCRGHTLGVELIESLFEAAIARPVVELQCMVEDALGEIAPYFRETGLRRECSCVAASISARICLSESGRRATATTVKPGGRNPSRARLYNAGISFRLVRSPVARTAPHQHGRGTSDEGRSRLSGLAAEG